MVTPMIRELTHLPRLSGHLGERPRTYFFYVATVNTPAMALKMVGVGSQYAILDVDRSGDCLDGGRTYRLTVPADPPARDFWSVVAHDPQSRSSLRTGQPYPSKNSGTDRLDENDDGSFDLYFGRSAPERHDANWIETVRGKGWFLVLRLYGPLEAWFDQTWRPGEPELVDGPAAPAGRSLRRGGTC
jgi:hypothetical protein